MNTTTLTKTSLVLSLAISLTATIELANAKSNEAKSHALTSIDAESALKELKSGNQRFLTGKVRKDGQAARDVKRLATGQAPNSVVLSCSDSRIPPEAVFDQKLGEMFTVRSAGQSLSPEAIGSMEYAIEKLGSHLIVVLGHTSCGAVKAAAETIGGSSLGSDNLDKLVKDIQPRIKSVVKNGTESKDLKDESWANAKGIAKDLLSRSKLISAAVDSGRVKIVVGLYDLSSGAVEFER